MFYGTEGVEREACLYWYRVSCGSISELENANLSDTVWYCNGIIEQREKELPELGVKGFIKVC